MDRTLKLLVLWMLIGGLAAFATQNTFNKEYLREDEWIAGGIIIGIVLAIIHRFIGRGVALCTAGGLLVTTMLQIFSGTEDVLVVMAGGFLFLLAGLLGKLCWGPQDDCYY